jgi:hypothetical protein
MHLYVLLLSEQVQLLFIRHHISENICMSYETGIEPNKSSFVSVLIKTFFLLNASYELPSLLSGYSFLRTRFCLPTY